jgi:hypothetical protein
MSVRYRATVACRSSGPPATRARHLRVAFWSLGTRRLNASPPQTSRVPVLLRVPAGPKLSIRPTVACRTSGPPATRAHHLRVAFRSPCMSIGSMLNKVPAAPPQSTGHASVFQSFPRSSSESRPVLSRVLGRRSPGNHQVRLRLGPITSESPLVLRVSIGRILHPVPDAPPQSTGLRGRLVRAPAPPLGRTKPSRAKLLLDFSADGRLGIFRSALSFSVNIYWPIIHLVPDDTPQSTGHRRRKTGP